MSQGVPVERALEGRALRFPHDPRVFPLGKYPWSGRWGPYRPMVFPLGKYRWSRRWRGGSLGLPMIQEYFPGEIPFQRALVPKGIGYSEGESPGSRFPSVPLARCILRGIA